MLFRIFISFCLFSSLVYGVSQEARQIKKHYKSLARDFVIYNFVKKKSTTKEDALYLYDGVYRKNARIKRAFYKKIKDKKLIYPKSCKKCVSLHISPRKFAKLSLKKQRQIYKKLQKTHSKKKLFWLRAMMAKDTFKALSYANAKEYLKVFNSVNTKYKHKVLDKKMSSTFLTRLANERKFTRFVLHVVMDKDYKNLPKNLLKLNPNRKKMSFNTAFYIGLLALKYEQKQKALKFFRRALKETKRKSYRNKVRFWQYQITKNPKILQILANGSDLNFYTLWAKEKLHLKNVQIITPKPKKQWKEFEINDPFLWAKIVDFSRKISKKELHQYAQKFYTKQTLSQYTFLEERASSYRKNFFITPFEEHLKGTSAKRKALIYSIARQESRFIPSAVSTSYALGMMQFMPFLAIDTAKKLQIKNFKYFDMFKPKIALKFANYHLDFLEKYLKEPLLIAYAYNGGLTFTKRLFSKNGLFQKGKHEPFMSMELIPYSESREYGKKVITNYAQYAKIYNLPIKLSDLYKNLLHVDLAR